MGAPRQDIAMTAVSTFDAQASATDVSKGAGSAILAMAIGSFGIGMGEFAVMGMLPELARDLGVSEPQAGHVISAYALGVVVGAPAFSLLFAKLPRRAMLLCLMLAFAIANIGCALAPDYKSLLLMRFISGLPHGAYFGIAALVAASLVPVTHRARAVGLLMLGLTIATLIGMPLASWIGQWMGWRPTFAFVGFVGALAFLSIMAVVPAVPAESGAGARRELSALRHGQVWLTLAITAIGCGGMFSVITYVVPLLTDETGLAMRYVPFAVGLFGVGLTVGNTFGARMADRALMPTIGGMLALNAVMLGILPWTAASVAGAAISIFFVGFSGAIGAGLQTRLMDVARDGQTLAATLMHGAFNIANALGAFLGGLAISAGYGWSSTGPVGSALAVLGLAVFFVSLALDRRTAAKT